MRLFAGAVRVNPIRFGVADDPTESETKMNAGRTAGGAAWTVGVRGRWAGVAVAVVGAWAAVTPSLAAQQKISFEGQAGVAVPTGNLGTLTDPGANLGLQVGYALSPRVALNLDGNVDLLNGARAAGGETAPDLRLWRYGLGLAGDLLPSERWALVASAGAGVGRVSSGSFTRPGSSTAESLSETYFTSNAGLKLGYAVSPRVMTYVGARGFVTAADEADTEALASLDPTRFRAFGSAISVPVTLGMNIKVGGGRRARVAEAPARTSRPASETDDRQRREAESRRICEEAESAIASRDYARARTLYERAKREYPGTMCADAADRMLERVADLEILAERIHFDFDRSEITNAGAETLQRKADVLARYPDLKLVVEGHCDERGSLEYNQALGMRRALSAINYMVALGVPQEALTPVTYGKERPLVRDAGERAWTQNRRDEFVLQNPGGM